MACFFLLFFFLARNELSAKHSGEEEEEEEEVEAALAGVRAQLCHMCKRSRRVWSPLKACCRGDGKPRGVGNSLPRDLSERMRSVSINLTFDLAHQTAGKR